MSTTAVRVNKRSLDNLRLEIVRRHGLLRGFLREELDAAIEDRTRKLRVEAFGVKGFGVRDANVRRQRVPPEEEA